jgi:hypothetical protein
MAMMEQMAELMENDIFQTGLGRLDEDRVESHAALSAQRAPAAAHGPDTQCWQRAGGEARMRMAPLKPDREVLSCLLQIPA